MRILGLTALVTIVGEGYGTSGAVVSDNDACFFVGMRFAQIPSREREGQCTGILVRGDGTISTTDGDGERITVSAAERIMVEHLESIRNRLDHEKAKRLPASTLETTEEVIRSTWLGFAPDMKLLLQKLGQSSLLIWSRASSDWKAWRADLNDDSVGSTQALKIQLSFLYASLPYLLRQPFWSRNHRAAVESCMFYLADLVAVMGPEYADFEMLLNARALMSGSEPLFRPIERREYRFQVPKREVVANDAMRGSFESVARFVGMWDHPGSLADNALGRIVATVICKNPVLWLRQHPTARQSFSIPIVKLGVNLVDLCSQYGEVRSLKSLKHFLSRKLPGKTLTLSQTEAVTGMFMDPGVDFGRGLSARVSERDKARALVRMVNAVSLESNLIVPITHRVNQFRFQVLSESGRSEGEFIETVGGLGRAMGLAIRYGASLRHLHLAPVLVELLHPRRRAKLSFSAMKDAAAQLKLSDGQGEDLQYTLGAVAIGMDEGLGPGGFASLSEARWLRLFVRRN